MLKKLFLDKEVKKLKTDALDRDLTLWLRCENCRIESDRLIDHEGSLVCSGCIEALERRKMLLQAEKDWETE